MASIIDTHCHLDLLLDLDLQQTPFSEAQQRAAKLLEEAQSCSVSHIVTIGTHVQDSMYGTQLADKIPNIFATVGIHPTELHPTWREDLTKLNQLLRTHTAGKIVGIGECGIDLHHKTTSLTDQKALFRAQIELALTHALPLIVHTRNAPEETLDCLQEYSQEPLRGIIHCFSYDISYAREYLQRNFLLGIGGTLTYPKNDTLRDVAGNLPLTSFVLETDAPFLAPQKIRGQRNHPRETYEVTRYLAELRGIELTEVATTTTQTAKTLLKIN